MASAVSTNVTLSAPRKQTFLPVPDLPVPGYIAHFDAGNLPWPPGAKVPQLRNLTGSAIPSVGQPTPGNQPTLGVSNGFRHIDSAGASALLRNDIAIAALPQPLTLLVVTRLNTNATGALLGASPVCSIGVNNASWFASAGTAITGQAVETGKWKVVIATINGSASALSVNGIETPGSAGANTMQNIRLLSGDAATYTNAAIRKAVIWPAALTQRQRDQMVSYLTGYYGDIS